VVDVDGALRRPARRTVDVVLLDLLPPECLNVLQRLRQLHRRVRVVAIGVREVESEVLACAAAGIDGYVPVTAAADDLVAVFDGLKRDELVCRRKSRSPSISA
jgi:two-component system nitrate/nitrite response regulator NarL